jgi:hypothetical protein
MTTRPKVSALGFILWLKRTQVCCVVGCGSPFVDPHHSPTRGAQGSKDPEKIHPNKVSPLCRFHHSLLDSPGWSEPEFEKVFCVNFREDIGPLTWAKWSALPPDERERWAAEEKDGSLGLEE